MKIILPLALLCLVFTHPGFGKCKSSISNSQFPNYGIMQYFVPLNYSIKSVNKPLLFLDSNFLPGKIVTSNNNIIKPKGIRYNVSEDEIECQFYSQYSRISSPHKLNEVEINGNFYVYKKHLHKGDSISGYLQKIHTGAKNLYVKHFAKKMNTPYTRWDIKNIFYVEENGNLPKKVTSLRAAIIEIYKGKASLANSFMKENNYSWRDAKALILLVDYLETISVDNVVSR